MASWMVHLCIADRLLDELSDVSAEHFIMGNIAPDSGEPNEDWSIYKPDKAVSHYEEAYERERNGRRERAKRIRTDLFLSEYFTQEKRAGYTREQDSFYLGYLTHLMTDILWRRNVFDKSMAEYEERAAEDRDALIWELKADWYDLDFLYLKKHPDFRAFRIYSGLAGFKNCYMDQFSKEAFDDRRKYITAFYLAGKDNLEREYMYLTPEAANQFVGESCADILRQIKGLALF